MAGSQSGVMSGETEATLKMQDIFSRSKEPNAGTINLVVFNNDAELAVHTLNLDPATAHHFRTHALLEGRELDPEKVKAAGIENVQNNASYYSFPDFSRAVVQDYNLATGAAVKVYNSVVSELGYADETLGAPGAVEHIADINAFHWDTMERMLEGARNSAMGTPGFYADNTVLVDQINPAIQGLQNAGAQARSLSEFHFQEVKPHAPGMEVPPFDYDSLLAVPGGAAGGGPDTSPRVK